MVEDDFCLFMPTIDSQLNVAVFVLGLLSWPGSFPTSAQRAEIFLDVSP